MKFLFKFVGKKTLAGLLLLAFSLAVLDMLSIAIIFPFLKILSTPSLIESNNTLSSIRTMLGISSAQSFIVWLGVGLVLFFAVKFVATFVFTRLRFSINTNIARRLSDDLFKLMMGADYSYLLKNSVSEMSGIINSHTIHGTLCLEAWVTVATESLFLLLLFVSMLIISPLFAVACLGLLFILSIPMYFLIVKKTTVMGREQTDVHLKQYKFLVNIINGIKDIKIMGLEKDCQDEHNFLNQRFAVIVARFNTFQTLPRSVIELIIMAGFVGFCIAALALNYDLVKLLPFFGFIVLGSIRMIPSYGKIVGAYNSFKYYQESLGLVAGLFASLSAHQHHVKSEIIPFTKAIRIESLDFNYDHTQILENVNLIIPKGTSAGIVGSSGSGKTTFLDVLAGLKEAKQVRAYLDDQPFDIYATDALKHFVGYVPQTVSLIDDSIAFNITFQIKPDQEKLERAAKMARIHDFIAGLPGGYSTVVGENGMRLSGGQKQRIGIARALYRDPEILIFDEATSSLDTITERELANEIHALSGKKTLIVVSHRLATVEKCDKIYVFGQGGIIASGTHDELMRTCDHYSAMNLGTVQTQQPC